MKSALILILTLILITSSALAQQEPDTSFLPDIKNPAFQPGQGPVIMIDEAHHNFHTMSGRYLPFARLCERDGYTVQPNTVPFSTGSLAECDILVISNALNERNTEDWSLPTPSAFTEDEIKTVKLFVENGGSLFLIADHMPFPGAAGKLAAVFGFELNNGFAVDPNNRGPAVFRRSDSTFRGHILRDVDSEKLLDSVASFTGEAFRCKDCKPLLIFDSCYVSLMPEEAWEFNDSTPQVDVKDWYQGAISEYGQGRVAMFGEAAMFTAQKVEGGNSIGLTSPVAKDNLQFLRDILRWLAEYK
ncbi:MAG: hypothetical protein JXA92_07900 [candidate division Zixibacteria bacterium]|nr:hypothetical protein [candidate division Zixibacteria bacterium]